MFSDRDIVIALDTSKRNTALVVGDLHGNVICDFEFGGETDTDVLKLCEDQRKAAKVLFSNSRPKLVGIEDIITKKGNDISEGMKLHQSRFKITAVFMSFIFFFQEYFSIQAELIPNQSWKSAVLPKEFRTHDGTKGSLAYFKSIQSPSGFRTDDVTDALCIYQYLCQKHKFVKAIEVTDKQPKRKNFTYCYTSTEKEILAGMLRFMYNKNLNLDEHSIFISNFLGRGGTGYVDFPTKLLPLSEIYSKHLLGSYKRREEELRLVVVNES
jgi:hypothetical protein